MSLAYCNNENKINLLLQVKNIDLLINPVGTNETLVCLGKHMSFYDRTIEYVLTEDKAMIDVIKDRYIIKKVLTTDSVYFLNIKINRQNPVVFDLQDRKIAVYQRQLKQIDTQFLINNFEHMLRPQSEDFVETVLKNKQNSVIIGTETSGRIEL